MKILKQPLTNGVPDLAVGDAVVVAPGRVDPPVLQPGATRFDERAPVVDRALVGESASQALVPQRDVHGAVVTNEPTSVAGVRVEHEPTRGQFLFDLPNSEPAHLRYARTPEGHVDLRHTSVPEAGKGQGIGGKLAEAAFAWCRARDTKIAVTCPFVAKWLEKHPEQRDLVVSVAAAT